MLQLSQAKGKAAAMNTPRTCITVLLLLSFITEDWEPGATDQVLSVTGVQTPEPHYHFSAYCLATQCSHSSLIPGTTIFSSTLKMPPAYRETVSLEFFFRDLKLSAYFLPCTQWDVLQKSLLAFLVEYLRCTECSKMYKEFNISDCAKCFQNFSGLYGKENALQVQKSIEA